ncbi:MAG: ferrous iron transport protein B [Acidilobaceae archaeon]
MNKTIRVALIGPPNSGKTLLFNLITGARAKVSNWPGTTVEQRVGYRWHKGYKLEVFDLPGLYSLSGWSPEQEVSAKFLLEEPPDVVVAVLDASNLERGLYLVLQLLETELKIVIALNKIDLAEKLGIEIDVAKLSEIMSCPVVPTVATKAQGLSALLDSVVSVYKSQAKSKPLLYESVEELAKRLMERTKNYKELKGISLRRVALALLEKDRWALSFVNRAGLENLLEELREIEKSQGDPSALVAQARLEKANSILIEVQRTREAPLYRLSDLVDKAVLDPHLSIPILLSLFWALFIFTFKASEPFVELLESFINVVSNALLEALPQNLLSNLIVEGVVAGVGAVVVLLPILIFLFIGLAILDDTGYMARVSGLLDPVASRAGLSGRSVLPLAVCLGCNVVGVKATRIISDSRERLRTILVAPFMSCPARLPVYVVVSSAVLGGSLAPVALMYFLSLAVILSIALGLKKTVIREGRELLFTELPEYSLPALINIKNFVIEKTLDFVKRAGTVLVLASIAVWMFLNIGVPEGGNVEESLGARVAKLIEHLFKPLDFDWRLVLALLSGFLAKEVVVSTLAIAFGDEEERIAESLGDYVTPASGLAFMTFVLLYTPCAATIAAIWDETKSLKWTLFSIALSLLVAYIVSTIVYFIAKAVI